MELRDLYLKINPAQDSVDGIGYTDQVFYIEDSSKDFLKLKTFKNDYTEVILKEEINQEFISIFDFLTSARRVFREGFRTKPIVDNNNNLDYSFYQNNQNTKVYSIDRFTDSCLFLPFFGANHSEDSIFKHFPKENIIDQIKKDIIIRKTQNIIYNNNLNRYVILFYNTNHMLIHKIDYKKHDSEELVIVPKKYLDFNWGFKKHNACGLNYNEIESLFNEQLTRESQPHVKQIKMH